MEDKDKRKQDPRVRALPPGEPALDGDVPEIVGLAEALEQAGELGAVFPTARLSHLGKDLARLEDMVIRAAFGQAGPLANGSDDGERFAAIQLLDSVVERLQRLRVATDSLTEPPTDPADFLRRVMQEFRISKRYRSTKRVRELHGGKFAVDLAGYIPPDYVVDERLITALAKGSPYKDVWEGSAVVVMEVFGAVSSGVSGCRVAVLRVLCLPANSKLTKLS